MVIIHPLATTSDCEFKKSAIQIQFIFIIITCGRQVHTDTLGHLGTLHHRNVHSGKDLLFVSHY